MNTTLPAPTEATPQTDYAIDPTFFHGCRAWYLVDREEEAEIKAGAHLGDLGVVTDLLDTPEDPNASMKMFPNFRGVYASRRTNLRIYFFQPINELT